MITSLEGLVAGATRVKSLKTGSVGTISRLYSEAERQARYDALEIQWDIGKQSYLFLMGSEFVALVDDGSEALVRQRQAQRDKAIEVDIDKI